MTQEVESLINELIQITYFMRGGVQYEDLLYMRSAVERSLMTEFITKRLEVEKEKMHPIY